MEDIYSFEVYCTWSDTKYGINGAAANPVRVTIYDDFDQKFRGTGAKNDVKWGYLQINFIA